MVVQLAGLFQVSGMRGPKNNKRDENESTIVDYLRKCGLSVYRLDQPLDLLIGFKGKTYLAEVKNGPKAPFTPAQQEFIRFWRGQYAVFSELSDAEDFVADVKGADSVLIEHKGSIS